jgi:hypothetical protein
MDNKTFTAPLQATMHRAAEQAITLQREAGELYVNQAKVATSSVTQAMDAFGSMVAAQHKANLAMGQVLVDAMKPTETKAS